MNSRLIFYPVIFFVGLVLQFGWSQFFTLWGLAPNIILVLVIFSALSDGPFVGQWMGFFWGLAWDAMSVSLFGGHVLVFTIIGYLAGMLSRQWDETKISSQAIIVLICSVLYTALLWVVYQVFSPAQSPMQLNLITVLQPFCNVLIAPILFGVGRMVTAGMQRDS
jgi:rod shape-determining protein MreD